jgi:excisionase family DNA binding protein
MSETSPNGSPSLDQLAEVVAEALAPKLAPLLVASLNQSPSEPYLTVEQAAEYLGCKPKRIYELVRQGRLLPYREGRRLLFRREDLDACLVREPRE